jgi:hypothetical protein
MDEGERNRLGKIMARQCGISRSIDVGWETLRCKAIGFAWGRDTATAVQIVGAEQWVLRAELSR